MAVHRRPSPLQYDCSTVEHRAKVTERREDRAADDLTVWLSPGCRTVAHRSAERLEAQTLRGEIMVAVQAEPKSHHYVPKLHLRRFADPNGNIGAADRAGGGKSFVLSVNKAATENWFYSITLADGRRSADFEKQLSSIESEIAGVLDSAISNSSLPTSRADREILAGYVALQFLRTPLVRALNRKIGELIVAGIDDGEAIRQIRSNVEGKFGIDPGDELVAPAWEEAKSGLLEYYLGSNANEHLKFVATHLGSLARRLMSYPTGLVTWSRRTIITSDSPVSLWSQTVDANADDGIGLFTAENIVVPLSRQSALLLVRPDLGFRDGQRILGTTRNANYVRAVVAANCHRWIFHHPEDGPIGDDLPAPVERIRKLSDITDAAGSQ
ncbi:DUF4238 domain-containing protein [Pseudofrankia sp. BMG5.36]|uniref:DUF4238 domain-containing protein n=1 Tax=Pseudofrankia sp. BMG5.36 TaxID=1834512 RepID=UPI0012FF6DC7|nr:DUF4238 domain-containing protein [Pseudofrankia sp. BMG5.36]